MIRVLVERRAQPGKENELHDLLVELRATALKQLGYISGETLRSADDPSLFLVISTWTTVETWRAWETGRTRLLVQNMIEPLLAEPERKRVFLEVSVF